MTTVTIYAVESENTTRHFYFVCPTCLRPTSFMVMLEKQHEPTDEELAAAGYGIFELIGNEVMACPCGRELTWFQMMCMERVC